MIFFVSFFLKWSGMSTTNDYIFLSDGRAKVLSVLFIYKSK